MADYDVIVQDAGKTLSFGLVNLKSVEVVEKLNQLNQFTIVAELKSSYERTNTVAGAYVNIHRAGQANPFFLGIIEKLTNTSGDEWIIEGMNSAVQLVYRAYGTLAPLTFNNTDVGGYTGKVGYDALGNGDLYGMVLGSQVNLTDPFTALTNVGLGTIDAYLGAGGNLSMRFSSINRLKSVAQIANAAGQDWWVDTNEVLQVRNHRGSTTSVYLFQGGVNAKDISSSTDYSKIVNEVTVLGSGDGNNQLRATSNDAASQAAYGIREPPTPIVNRTLFTQELVQAWADRYIEVFKNPSKEITFTMTVEEGTEVFGLGDVARVLDAGNFIDESVRITGITRSWNSGVETIQVEVTTDLINNIVTNLEQIGNDVDTLNTAPQGATNVYQVIEEENLEAGVKTFQFKFYIPSTDYITFINNALLNFEVVPFLAYSSQTDTTAATGTTDSGTTGITLASAGQHSHTVIESAANNFAPDLRFNYDYYRYTSSLGTAAAFVTNTLSSVTNFQKHRFSCRINNHGGAGTWTGFYRLRDTTTGTNLIGPTAFSIAAGIGLQVTATESVTNRSGNSIEWAITNAGGTIQNFPSGIDAAIGITSLNIGYSGSTVTSSIEPVHTHTLTDTGHTHTFTGNGHFHNMLYSMTNVPLPPAPANPSIQVMVNGNPAAGQPYAGSTTMIDITSLLVLGSTNTIEFTMLTGAGNYSTNDKLRIKANVFMLTFTEGLIGDIRNEPVV